MNKENIKITIDTNLLIYLFDVEFKEEDALLSCRLFKEILENSEFVNIDIKITTVVENDLNEDNDKVRMERILFKIRNIFQQIGVGEFIKYQNFDIPSKEEDRDLFNQLKKILFPELNNSSKNYSNKISDLKHIFSHIKNERNFYITNDKNFLKEKKKDTLLKSFNIQMCSPEDFIKLIQSFSSKSTYKHKTSPKKLDYQSLKLKDSITMDFKSNNGSYFIGNGDFIFEIYWGECCIERMRIYNDPETIESVAIAEDKKIKEITNHVDYDFTNRTREARRKKDILILKNSKGYYAAIKIINFGVKSRGSESDFLNFEYIINTKKECNFKNIETT